LLDPLNLFQALTVGICLNSRDRPILENMLLITMKQGLARL